MSDELKQDGVENQDVTNENMERTDTSQIDQAVAQETFDFKQHLNEELRDDTSLQDIKDLNALAKGYVSAQQMIGSSVRLPREDSSEEVIKNFYEKIRDVPGVLKVPDGDNPEELDAFYKKLGRPDKPEEYQVEIPETLEKDQGMVDHFNEVAFKLGLTKQQHQALVDFEVKRMEAFNEFKKTAYDNGVNTLKQNWGDQLETKVEDAKLAKNKYKEKYPEAMADLLQTQNNNPALTAILADIAQNMKDTGDDFAKTQLNHGLTPEDALQEIAAENYANSDHPANVPGHRDHAIAKARKRKLYEAAFPDDY